MPKSTKTGNTPGEQFGVKIMVKDISRKLGFNVPKTKISPTPNSKPKRSNVKPPVRPIKPGSKTVKTPMPLTGEAAAKAYRQSISPKGMASASAANKKALDKKYPGLYKSATPKPKKK